MSKQPMDWHRECFANFKDSLEDKRERVARQVADLEQSERRLAFYAEQIAAAEARGLAGFDRDRLLVKRQA